MGVSLYGSNQRVQESNNNNNNNNNNGEQLMLLRTLQDNERNIIGNRVIVTTTTKSNVSVIQPQNQRLDNDRNIISVKQQEQLPTYDPARLKKHGKNGQPPPIAVAKRNARERNRVKQVGYYIPFFIFFC